MRDLLAWIYQAAAARHVMDASWIFKNPAMVQRFMLIHALFIQDALYRSPPDRNAYHALRKALARLIVAYVQYDAYATGRFDTATVRGLSQQQEPLVQTPGTVPRHTARPGVGLGSYSNMPPPAAGFTIQRHVHFRSGGIQASDSVPNRTSADEQNGIAAATAAAAATTATARDAATATAAKANAAAAVPDARTPHAQAQLGASEW